MTTWAWVLLAVAVVVVVWVTLLCAARVSRLDRLHVRTDAARAGLESALERRAGAALAVAAVVDPAVVDPAVVDAAGAIDHARRLGEAVTRVRAARVLDADREASENALGRVLAAVDRSALPAAVLEELVDAEQLLILARRVHNDAVRDTLGLRSRRLVRWLHLAATAPLPAYFEIADAEPGVTTTAPVHRPERPVGPAR
ncbi:NUDIX hydrolase [Pseudonocardia nigra]|uniref:NUDIX hydrolase n=1 Tax=Pseudonocardia nigra TaxID=1921578 RepID=UPI001C5E2A3A|nr:NUDIX hydrolase [Pseudonocardia nigra]